MSSFTTQSQLGGISSRSQYFLKPPLGYVMDQLKAIFNEYHPETNPSGSIPLAVAENKLCADMLLEQMTKNNDYPKDVMNYTSSTGLPRVRSTFADFLGKYLFGGYRPDDDQLILSPGCCALLHQLSVLLFEAGDSILGQSVSRSE